MGMGNIDGLRDLVVDYFEEGDEEQVIPSTVGGSMTIAQKEFGAATDVLRAGRLRRVMTFRRKSDWDIP